MAWVQRDDKGAIVAWYSWPVDGAEELAEDDPEVMAFLAQGEGEG